MQRPIVLKYWRIIRYKTLIIQCVPIPPRGYTWVTLNYYHDLYILYNKQNK